jgi:Arc/MetJ family transcription regulator
MATNLAIDDSLIVEAMHVCHHKTKKAAVTAALKEYIEHHKQQAILKMFGTIQYEPDYDYKKQRERK